MQNDPTFAAKMRQVMVVETYNRPDENDVALSDKEGILCRFEKRPGIMRVATCLAAVLNACNAVGDDALRLLEANVDRLADLIKTALVLGALPDTVRQLNAMGIGEETGRKLLVELRKLTPAVDAVRKTVQPFPVQYHPLGGGEQPPDKPSKPAKKSKAPRKVKRADKPASVARNKRSR